MKTSALPLTLLAALLLLATACTKEEKAPPKPPTSEAIEPTLVVHPPDQGRRRAVLQLKAVQAVSQTESVISLPEGCRVTAGAQRRAWPSIPVGETEQSFLIFECPADTTGEVVATVEGTDAAGVEIKERLTASL